MCYIKSEIYQCEKYKQIEELNLSQYSLINNLLLIITNYSLNQYIIYIHYKYIFKIKIT